MGTSGTSPIDWNALPEFTLDRAPDADPDAPDHVRAAAYANQLLGASFEPGDSGKYAYLAEADVEALDVAGAPDDELPTTSRDGFDVIALERLEQFPDAFAVDVERTREAAHDSDGR